MMSRADRCWLAVFIPAWLLAFGFFARQAVREAQGPSSVAALVLFCVPVSAVVALFLIGIPLQLALNVMIAGRRAECLRETMVLIVTLAVLCYLILVARRYPPEG